MKNEGGEQNWGGKEGKFGGKMGGDGSRRFRTHESAFRKELQKCGSGKEGEEKRRASGRTQKFGRVWGSESEQPMNGMDNRWMVRDSARCCCLVLGAKGGE